MKRVLIFISLGILVILVIFVYGCISSDSQEPTGPQETQQADEALEEESTQEEPSVYEMGQSVSVDSLVVTVYSMTESQGGEYDKPGQGNKFIVLDIEIENTGDTPESVSTMAQMSIRTPEGYTYDQALYFPEPVYPDGTIQPGTKARGNVAFEVPQDITSMEFWFETFSETLRFKLG